MLRIFINTFIKFFFLLTPFFLMTSFLAMSRKFDEPKKKRTAIKVTLSIIIICIILFLIGNQIFRIFGITLNSFRIGTGILLFLSAITLVQSEDKTAQAGNDGDISVVPLAIPIAVGPATTGALLVMGVELKSVEAKIAGISGLLFAVLIIGIMLFLSGLVEKLLKKQGLVILTKITGLVLSAIAAEMVMTGIIGFMSV
jgi:multiple antibiotic resistance protein